MCTLVVLRHVHPEWPLVLAANRDELYARPAAGPQVLLPSPRSVGGRDLVRKGTWMGVTDGGLFVGLTNQRGFADLPRAPRSRGEVVLRALEAGSVEELERYLAGLEPREYNAFNLLYGNAEVLRVAHVRPDSERIVSEEVPPGVHVLPNDVLNTPVMPKVARARLLAEAAARKPWPECVQALKEMLADHELPERAPEELLDRDADAPELRERLRQYQALCIHTEGYGTRSSAILALAPGRVAHYLATDEAPCQGQYRDVTHLLYPARDEALAPGRAAR